MSPRTYAEGDKDPTMLATKALTGLQCYAALRRLHEILTTPYQWDSDTMESVGSLMSQLGFGSLDEDFVTEIEEEVGEGVITPELRAALDELTPEFVPELIDHGVLVQVLPSAGSDGAIVVLIDTQFEPDGSDGPGLRILLNDSDAYIGVPYRGRNE